MRRDMKHYVVAEAVGHINARPEQPEKERSIYVFGLPYVALFVVHNGQLYRTAHAYIAYKCICSHERHTDEPYRDGDIGGGAHGCTRDRFRNCARDALTLVDWRYIRTFLPGKVLK